MLRYYRSVIRGNVLLFSVNNPGPAPQEYITQEGYKLDVGAPKPPPAVTNAVSWRDPEGKEKALNAPRNKTCISICPSREGIKYRKNEVFLDVIESVDLLAGAQGQVLRSEIRGNVKVRHFRSPLDFLSGSLLDARLSVRNSRATPRPQ